MIGIMLGFGVPQLASSDFALLQAREQLIADLRNTRADALINGDHFRLDVTGGRTYAEYRMTLDKKKWKAAQTATRTRILPQKLSFTAGVGTSFEFDTRGLLVTPGAAQTLQIKDTRLGTTEQVTVWPSGQVAP